MPPQVSEPPWSLLSSHGSLSPDFEHATLVFHHSQCWVNRLTKLICACHFYTITYCQEVVYSHCCLEFYCINLLCFLFLHSTMWLFKSMLLQIFSPNPHICLHPRTHPSLFSTSRGINCWIIANACVGCVKLYSQVAISIQTPPWNFMLSVFLISANLLFVMGAHYSFLFCISEDSKII